MTKPAIIKRQRAGQRLLNCGYASILRHVQRKAQSAAEVASAMGLSRRTTSALLWRMADLRVVHEVEWVAPRADGQGTKVAVYAFGPGERAAYVPSQRKHAISKWNIAPELVAFAALVHAMLDEPRSTADLISVGGQNRRTLNRLIDHCRAIKLVRVGDWFWPAYGPPRPMFSIGSQADAARPQRISNKEACRRYGERKAAAKVFAPLAMAFSTRAEPTMAEAA